MQEVHTDRNLYPCDNCEIILNSKHELQTHIENDHVTQLDGFELDSFQFDNAPGTSTSIRSSNYTFNKDKQTSKIVNDALKDDYEVTINNDDQNVTIECSTGFYLQVAKPCFTTVKKGSVVTKAAIAVTLDDERITLDKNDVEATRLLHFSFMNNLNSCGGVRIHLHHSTRKIQIQGSHVMPNKQRSPVWFLDTVLLPKFKDLAKAKQFEIKKTNSAILNSELSRVSSSPRTPHPHDPSSLSNVCNTCSKIFDTKSRPSACNICGKFFHKVKCLKDHMRACKPQLQPSSADFPSTPQVSQTTLSPRTRPLPPSASNAAITSSASTTDLSTNTSYIPPPARMAGLQTLVSFVPNTSSGNTPPVSSAPTQSQPTFPEASLNQQRTNKKKQKLPPITNDQARINFLQTELNAAQARIVVLDKTVVDKDQELAVLWARIKILEEKQNKDVLDKYSLNRSGSNHKSSPDLSSQPSPTCTSSAPPHCCYRLLPPCSRTLHQEHCFSSCHHPRTVFAGDEFTDLKKDVNEIRAELTNIKSTILQQTKTVPTHSTINPTLPSVQSQSNDASILLSDTKAPCANNDDSIASIEEFMTDIHENDDNLPLNQYVPTIQQPLVEQ